MFDSILCLTMSNVKHRTTTMTVVCNPALLLGLVDDANCRNVGSFNLAQSKKKKILIK